MSRSDKLAQRLSHRERIWRVLQMKMEGETERNIAKRLAEDPVKPVKVSHAQINRDWHEAADIMVAASMGQAGRLRALMAARLEKLFICQWDAATAEKPDREAVEMCRKLIKDIRTIYGLDRELGDIDRPMNIQTEGKIDYENLRDGELDLLIGIGERQRNGHLPPAASPLRPPGP